MVDHEKTLEDRKNEILFYSLLKIVDMDRKLFIKKMLGNPGSIEDICYEACQGLDDKTSNQTKAWIKLIRRKIDQGKYNKYA